MNPKIAPTVRMAIGLLLLLAVLAVIAPSAYAAPVGGAHAAVLPAWDMMDIVHDRSRLIQFSILAVAFGIALLWWGQKW